MAIYTVPQRLTTFKGRSVENPLLESKRSFTPNITDACKNIPFYTYLIIWCIMFLLFLIHFISPCLFAIPPLGANCSCGFTQSAGSITQTFSSSHRKTVRASTSARGSICSGQCTGMPWVGGGGNNWVSQFPLSGCSQHQIS